MPRGTRKASGKTQASEVRPGVRGQSGKPPRSRIEALCDAHEKGTLDLRELSSRDRGAVLIEAVMRNFNRQAKNDNAARGRS